MAVGRTSRGRRGCRWRQFPQRHATQIRHKMRAELAHVVLGAVDEARLAPAHEVEAERIEPGRIHDAAFVPQVALAIEYWRAQPAVVGAEAGGPEHGADAMGFQIHEEPRVL